jgi:AcrR family transcriptional regulator
MAPGACGAVSVQRRRMSPEDRREHLLGCARSLVEEGGVPACTIDAIAQSAEVTPQLVHKYFGNRVALLEALYQTEQRAFTIALEAALAEENTLEEVVRVFVTANFDQLSGATAIGQLMSTPELAPAIDADRSRESRTAGKLLARVLAREYPDLRESAEFALTIGSAASIAAGDFAARRKRDREADIDATVRFIMAGIRSLASGGHD